MNILYIANHQAGGNDEEGAIYDALTALGHSVERCEERKATKTPPPSNICDLVLFHHWPHCRLISHLTVPKVFWRFDLVRFTDPLLSSATEARLAWCREALTIADLGFCTDGDFVQNDASGKLVHLTQGADNRVMRYTTYHGGGPAILFAGTLVHGWRRTGQVSSLLERYGDRFKIIGDRGHEPARYGEALAQLIETTEIVLAPCDPVTANYWSNRVYVTLGFGGFLLHPWSSGLACHYTPNEEIVFYNTADDCFEKIDYYLARPAERDRIRRAGYERTLKEHTYRHRVRQLLATVKERFDVPD